MIYRIICNGSAHSAHWLDFQDKNEKPPGGPRERLLGVWCANVRTDGFDDLKAPAIQNKRVRFYFTEKGWDLLGRSIAADARRDGRVVRVLRRKNPEPSEVVYEDDLQVAILPRRGVSRKNRK